MAHIEKLSSDEPMKEVPRDLESQAEGPTEESVPWPTRERDQALIDMARQGDKAKLHWLVMNYYSYFRHLCWKNGIPAQSRDDVFQELELWLLRKLHSLEIRNSFAGLVFSLVRTIAARLKTKDLRLLIDADEIPGSDDVQGQGEEFTRLQECQETLDPRELRLVLGRFYMGLPYATLAEELKIEVNNAYQILSRALAKLRDCLTAKGVQM